MGQVGNLSYVSLGYSGGAAPDSHRCSLFVGLVPRERPTTNAHRNGDESSRTPRSCQMGWKRKSAPPVPMAFSNENYYLVAQWQNLLKQGIPTVSEVPRTAFAIIVNCACRPRNSSGTPFRLTPLRSRLQAVYHFDCLSCFSLSMFGIPIKLVESTISPSSAAFSAKFAS